MNTTQSGHNTTRLLGSCSSGKNLTMDTTELGKHIGVPVFSCMVTYLIQPLHNPIHANYTTYILVIFQLGLSMMIHAEKYALC